MVIDPTSAIGKIRLRTGDWSDLPILPDGVIQSALDDSTGNVPRAAALCARYILATLTSGQHRKLATLEIWGSERFHNYVKFIQLTILNPGIGDIAPVPYSSEGRNTLQEFAEDWSRNYSQGTQSQAMAIAADTSPNDNSRTGLSSTMWGY